MDGAGFDATDAAIPSERDVYKTVQTDNALVPVTIRQILQSNLTPGEQTVIDGKPRKIVSIVGMVVGIEEVNIFIQYQVDDGTGVFQVLDYTKNEAAELAPPFEKYTYIYVVGRLNSGVKDNSGAPHISAFTIKQVTDPNQIAFHNLQALFVHLYSTRGFPANSAYEASQNLTQRNQYETTNTSSNAANSSPSLSREAVVQKAVLDFLRNRSHDENGIASTEIQQAFKNVYSVEEVQRAIDQLAFNGEIYNSSLNDHYAVC